MAECKFQDDLYLGALTRHTHRWGTDFSVWFEGGSRHGEHVWTSSDWQHDVDLPFEPPLLMKKGEGIRRDPAKNCQPLIDEHSSAVGLLRQVTICLESSGCSSACASAPAGG